MLCMRRDLIMPLERANIFFASAGADRRQSSAADRCQACEPVTTTWSRTRINRLPAVPDRQKVHSQELATSGNRRGSETETDEVEVLPSSTSSVVHLSQTSCHSKTPSVAIMGATLCRTSSIRCPTNQRWAAKSRVCWWQGLVRQQVYGWCHLHNS